MISCAMKSWRGITAVNNRRPQQPQASQQGDQTTTYSNILHVNVKSLIWLDVNLNNFPLWLKLTTQLGVLLVPRLLEAIARDVKKKQS